MPRSSGAKAKADFKADLMVSSVHLVHGDVPSAVNLLPRRLPPLTLRLRHNNTPRTNQRIKLELQHDETLRNVK